MLNPTALENGDASPYWQGAAVGKLLFQRCLTCHHIQFPPRHHCEQCWADAIEWIESSGRGTIESFTVVRRAPLPAFKTRVPYTIVAVRLDEGPRMITDLVGDGALTPAIGEAVEVTFLPDDNDTTLPRFQLSQATSGAVNRN